MLMKLTGCDDGQEQKSKSQEQDEVDTLPAPSSDGPGVQVDQVKHAGHPQKGLLEIPAPVPA